MMRITSLCVVFLFIGSAGIASAATGRPTMISPCGSADGVCGEVGGSWEDEDEEEDTILDPSVGCETSSWGDSSRGGTTTVCVGADGSNSWYDEEWDEDQTVMDSGRVIPNPDGSVTITTFSTDIAR